ncbi:hypothetical protein AB0P15_07560 [Streptomyces sp. NPDC087917]|uniref:hypothetical protein n=1 Tax=Streptomyces sp. NPDC087917 TaxID=3155060 RepID=UPI00343BE3E1
MGPVKAAARPLWRRSTRKCPKHASEHQEHTMADLAFVVTTIALFALVAFVAKGVAKL